MSKTFAGQRIPKHWETDSGTFRSNLRQGRKSVRQVAASADELHQAVRRLEETLKKVENKAKPRRRSRSEKLAKPKKGRPILRFAEKTCTRERPLQQENRGTDSPS